MTIPSRPAPPPPNSNGQRIGHLSTTNNGSHTTAAPVSRYTPTTDWDDKPFEMQPTRTSMRNSKKVPPPRPPPPKTNINGTEMPALKKPGTQHSVNILSNLFGSKRSKVPPNKLETRPTNNSRRLNGFSVPPKIPPPPGSTPSSAYSSFASTPASTSGYQLIDFNSPPSSPTFTQKSNSDCVSVDSFSSDSNCSPHNGNVSQAESGFEDDFNADPLGSRDPWETITTSTTTSAFHTVRSSDPFTAPVQFTVKPPIAQKPINIGSTSFYAYTSEIVKKNSNDDDPLCNGKSLIAHTPVTVPTIIRPVASGVPSIKPKPIFGLGKSRAPSAPTQKQDSLEDAPPSPPMPTCPPPPPPPEYFVVGDNDDASDEASSAYESHGISLYDFEGTQDGDLSFRENEKIYLLRKIDDEWYFGRDKRGCEGIFPVNYIDIKVPLGPSNTISIPSPAPLVTASALPLIHKVRVLYDFNAEVAGDLALRENDTVQVLYEINDEWLYGKVGVRQGQFPSNFIEFIPKNLPKMP